MTTVFEKPPLVEIIAEVKWEKNDAKSNFLPILPHESAEYDSFITLFSENIGELGYVNTERLIPINFPVLPHEPVIRYKKVDKSDGTLFQVGPRIFTANATPPYRSWDDFNPIVKKGIQTLFNTLRDDVNFSISLRYIDAFKENLTRQKSITDFLSEDLGIKIDLNKAITDKCSDINKLAASINLAIPLDIGKLNMRFGKGQVASEDAFLMDMSISSNGLLKKDIDSLMDNFNQARAVMHHIFIEITRPLHKLMGIKER